MTTASFDNALVVLYKTLSIYKNIEYNFMGFFPQKEVGSNSTRIF